MRVRLKKIPNEQSQNSSQPRFPSINMFIQELPVFDISSIIYLPVQNTNEDNLINDLDEDDKYQTFNVQVQIDNIELTAPALEPEHNLDYEPIKSISFNYKRKRAPKIQIPPTYNLVCFKRAIADILWDDSLPPRRLGLSKVVVKPIMDLILKDLPLRKMSREEYRLFDLFYQNYSFYGYLIIPKLIQLNDWKKSQNMSTADLAEYANKITKKVKSTK